MEADSKHRETEPPRNHLNGVQEQMETVETFVQKGLYQFITKDNFPDLPDYYLVTSLVYAADTMASRLENASHLTNDLDLSANLLRAMSETMNIGSRRATDLLGEVEYEGPLYQTSFFFRQDGALTALLEFAIRNGLPEAISAANFPALRALPDSEIEYLVAKATENRLTGERELKGDDARRRSLSAPFTGEASPTLLP